MKEKNKFVFLSVVALIIFVLLFLFRFLFGGPEDSWVCSGSEWVKHGNPSIPKPTGNCRK